LTSFDMRTWYVVFDALERFVVDVVDITL